MMPQATAALLAWSGDARTFILEKDGASQFPQGTHAAACQGHRWAAPQALHCRWPAGPRQPTWMLAGPHSMKLASLRSRMRCKLLCTCVGSTSPCIAGGYMQEERRSHRSGSWVTESCNEADAVCLHSGHQQQRCSASSAQGMQHTKQCRQPFSVHGQFGGHLHSCVKPGQVLQTRLAWMMLRMEMYFDLSYSFVRACADTMMFFGCSSRRITSSTAAGQARPMGQQSRVWDQDSQSSAQASASLRVQEAALSGCCR